MKNIISILMLFCLFLFTGCATVFKGYYDDVTIIDPPDGLEIYTPENVKIHIQGKYALKGGTGNPYEYVPPKIDTVKKKYFISLRSSQDHTLTLKYLGKEKKIILHKKLGFGWVILDILTGGFPLFIDMYTGNWNHFDEIDETFE